MLQTNRISRNNLVGFCEIDLLEFLSQVSIYYHIRPIHDHLVPLLEMLHMETFIFVNFSILQVPSYSLYFKIFLLYSINY